MFAKIALISLTLLKIELSKFKLKYIFCSCDLYDEMIVNRSLKFHPHLLQPYELCQLDQNYDYCTDNDVLGPIYPSHELINSNEVVTNPIVAAATRNLYFLATHDLFDMDSMYEYH